MRSLWAHQPDFSAEELGRICVSTWVADGDHEASKRSDTLFIADHIPDSGLLILPDVSHFAFLRDPREFDLNLRHFLTHVRGR